MTITTAASTQDVVKMTTMGNFTSRRMCLGSLWRFLSGIIERGEKNE